MKRGVQMRCLGAQPSLLSGQPCTAIERANAVHAGPLPSPAACWACSCAAVLFLAFLVSYRGKARKANAGVGAVFPPHRMGRSTAASLSTISYVVSSTSNL